MSAILASGVLVEKTFWYPTLVGAGVFIAAVILFCGSVYLLLSTNVGARLGFLISGAALSGFMCVLLFLWMVTAYPLNVAKGELPAWQVVEISSDIVNAKTTAVRTIQNNQPASAIELANLKAAVDEALVAKKKEGVVEPKPLPPVVTDWLKTSGFSIAESTDYQILKTNNGQAFAYETGGGKPNPLSFQFRHKSKYAVIGICATDKAKAQAEPPVYQCDTSASAPPVQYIVLERNLGSVRVPPVVMFIAAALSFGVFLLLLYWWEMEHRKKKNMPGGVPTPDRELVKAGS